MGTHIDESIRKKIEEKIDKRFVLTGGIATAIFKEAAEFGYQLAQEEKKFKPCGEGDNICSCKSEDECGYLESQDELWGELEDNCMGYDEGSGGFLVIEEAKKRYRITRI